MTKITKAEALSQLRRLCKHLIEHGTINEGTTQAAALFRAAKTLGAFQKEYQEADHG